MTGRQRRGGRARPSGAARVLGVAVLGALAACGGPGDPVPVDSGTVRPLASQPVDADGGLACPDTITDPEGMTVPAPPQGVDGSERLLPDRLTETLVVCRYPVLDLETGALPPPYALETRTVPDEDQRQEIVETLAWAPLGTTENMVCTMMAGDETVLLVGATYADAVVWVAAKSEVNGCSGATNGDATSRAAVGSAVEAIVRGGDRPAGDAGGCDTRTWGRLGDDTSLAPTGDPQVTVCRSTAAGDVPTVLDPAASREVVAALRGLDVEEAAGGCAGEPDADRSFRLVLGYGQGPDAQVTVAPGCDPEVVGGGLQAQEAGDLVDLVERWSPPVPAPDPNAPVSTSLSDG